MPEWLLALNVGSSSVKFAAFPCAGGSELLRGAVFSIDDHPQQRLRRQGEATSTRPCDAVVTNLLSAIDHAIDLVFSSLDHSMMAGVGHRIVHGGAEFIAPTVLTPEVVTALVQLEPLAPLHQPASLAAIDLVSRRAPDALQIGCFDTAFHVAQPRTSRMLAIPRAMERRGVRRYGFHGLSYQHVAEVLAHRYGANAGGRAVVAHLGAGSSLCALREGVSVATTMGMTPLGGIPMATRSGDLDPGVVLYLLEEVGLGASDIRDVLYRRSGLLGVSEESGDLRTLLASERPQSSEAVTYFVECVQREIASLAGVLSGLDTIVFTGGIGENASTIRGRISAACAWMGVHVDEKRNEASADEIQAADSAVRVVVVKADEEAVIAAQVRESISAASC